MSERDRFDQIAARIADGEPVDWSAEHRDGESNLILRKLKLLESLSRSLSEQAANQDEAGLVRHLEQTFDQWLQQHAADEADSVPEHWGRLRITGLHGRGTYADVYEALDPVLEREVALKLFRAGDPALQQRLMAEGRRLAKIDHPNVVRIYDAEVHHGRAGLWMESIRGKTLEQWVSEHGPMGADEAAAVGLALCSALSAVHRAGVLHRDIKAQNVMRADGGRIVLADFGSGVDMSGPEASGLGGTPLYLAPEVLNGAPASVAADVYGLGVLLFFLLSGEYPVAADTLPALQQAHESGARKRIRDLRPELGNAMLAAVEKAISPDPGSRFESMGAFADALAETRRPSRPGRRLAWLAVGLLGLVAMAWLGVSVNRTPVDSPAGEAAAAYQVDATLYRQGANGAQVLHDGDTVQVGDRLSLSFSASKEVYVYVFNIDERGHAFGLFPLAALGQGNPLQAGTPHLLPGEKGGGTLTWQVDRPGGMERVHLFVSPAPVPEIERQYRRLPPATLTHSQLAQRGIGSVSAAPVATVVPAEPLLQAVRELSESGRRVEGAWHRVFRLSGDGS